MIYNVVLKKSTKSCIQLAKTILAKKVTPEEAVLLARTDKNISDEELKMVIPLSHYNYWLNKARETALELKRYAMGLSNDVSPLKRQDLIFNIRSKAQTIYIYYLKAVACYKVYKYFRKKNNPAIDKPVVLPVPDKSAQSA